MRTPENNDKKSDDNCRFDQSFRLEESNVENVAQTIPPSHCLEDGRFVFLPPPSVGERSRFFQRSIDRYGLLQCDMETTTTSTKKQGIIKIIKGEGEVKNQNDDQDGGKNGNCDGSGYDGDSGDDKTRLKVHPLAIASARLQSNGLNELNRAINLATLVNTGEFFSYTNVVDPSFEVDATGTTNNNNSKPANDRTTDGTVSSAYYSAEATAQRTEALFSLKRKRKQYEKASRVLVRHERRIYAAVKAQHVIDKRLFELRQQWRLVAPEHGTRARLHTARTNEIIAVDVDVYDRDRVRGGSQALIGRKRPKVSRLASRVPRFATIELQDNFKVNMIAPKADEKNKTDGKNSNNDCINGDRDSITSKCEGTPEPNSTEENNFAKKYTRAEPYAVANQTLGKVTETFDTSKIPMLNLQLDIQKSSTGFTQSAYLEPMTTLSSAESSNCSDDDTDTDNNGGIAKNTNSDEELLILLQHSLFCANLFESIRNELDADSIGKTSSSLERTTNSNKMAWLASESEENYVAPPSFLVDSECRSDLSALSVVHCHEGEVKVQLDSEYQLRLKLVEANAEEMISTTSHSGRGSQGDSSEVNSNSGSQSPNHLHAFCRALLLYAQDVYHHHSLYLHEREKKKRKFDAAKGEQRGLARIKKEDVPEQARILQSCVSLGSKMLFEQRIRKSLSRVSNWLTEKHGEKFTVEWLSLSIFDLHSKFAICCRHLIIDGLIFRDSLTVTRIDDSDVFRKAHFHTDQEFEIYLKLELQRIL